MAGKSDIVDHLANSVEGMTKKTASEATEAVFDCISGALAKGDRVQIPGFGSFQVSHRQERKGRNPKTREGSSSAASSSVRFKPGKALKESVN